MWKPIYGGAVSKKANSTWQWHKHVLIVRYDPSNVPCLLLYATSKKATNYWCNELHNKVYAHDYGILFLQLSTTLLCFFPRTFFSKKGILPSVFQVSNGLSLWCLRPWINHLPLVWWSPFRVIFLKWQSVCKVGVTERNYLLSSCFYYFFSTLPKGWQLFCVSFFCFEINFYTKYFVLSYSIHVVSTLFLSIWTMGLSSKMVNCTGTLLWLLCNTY